MFLLIKMQCPNCDFNNSIDIEISGRKSRDSSHIVKCGSCEKDFALYSTMNITAYAKKIVDEENES